MVPGFRAASVSVMRLWYDMMADTGFEQRSIIQNLLKKQGLLEDPDFKVVPLAGDGSTRRFSRIVQSDVHALVAVMPPTTSARDLAEAASSYRIGKHLFERGIAVPAVFGFDEETGTVLFEDLGDCHLHAVVRDEPAKALPWYRAAIDELIRLQISGRQGFDVGFCWDTPRYDKALMLERESGYFLQAFCKDYLGMDAAADDPAEDFERLASRAAQEPADFLLHRDFQSRNLMIHENHLRVIDFQGARFGPLAYDLASLLNDPYAALPDFFKEELFEYYLGKISKKIHLDQDRFRNGYYYIAMERNLQILGAFSFLTMKKKKIFFMEFMKPAALSLVTLLAKPAGAGFPVLQRLAAAALENLINMHLQPEKKQ